MPFGKGIAGHVAETGVSLNIKDAYDCELFHSVVDKETGFHTTSVLCCAVTDTSGKRTAVIQVSAFLLFHKPAAAAAAAAKPYCPTVLCLSGGKRLDSRCSARWLGMQQGAV